MANFEQWINQDLQDPVQAVYSQSLAFSSDNDSILVGVHVTDGGEPATLSGNVVAHVIRSADGGTVSFSGTLSGSDVSAILPEACFAYPGQIAVMLQLVSGTTKTTLCKALYSVVQGETGTPIDPGSVVPDLDDLLAMLDEMAQATDAAESAAAAVPAIIAPTFSPSTPYTAGRYVYYNGALYRFTDDHAAGAWTGSDATSVQLAPEVADLKSATNVLNDYVLPAQVYSGTKNIVASTTQYIDDFQFQKDKTYVIEYNTVRTVSIGSYPASQGGSITLSNASNTAEFTPTATGRPFLYSSYDGNITLTIKVKKNMSLVDDMISAKEDIGIAKEDITELKETLTTEIVVGGGTYQCEKQVAKELGFSLVSGTEYTIRYNASATCNFWANTASTGGYVALNGTGETTYTPTASGEASAYFTAVAGTLEIEVVIPNNEAIPVKINEINERLDSISPKEYTVGTGGNYATLTDAFNALADDTSWKALKIKGGTYDIYEELGGAEWLSTLTGSENWYDVSTFVPLNTKLIGIGMVTLNFNLPDTTPSAVAGLLSCLNVAGSVYMENITIYCDNCRYGIHDEYVAEYGTNADTSHIYNNVHVFKKRTTTGSTFAFGCGQNENETFIFDGCTFIHADDSASATGMLFHNRYANDNSTFLLKNCSVKGYKNAIKFGASNFGTGESHEKVTISNCYLKATHSDNDVICERQSPDNNANYNPYDVTLSMCGDSTVSVSSELVNGWVNPVVYG